MDNIEGVKLLQKVCATLYQKGGGCTYRVALNELMMLTNEPEAHDDLWGVLDAWGRLVTGKEDPQDTVTLRPIGGARWPSAPTEERRRMRQAEALAIRQGGVTSRELANVTGLSQESARLLLVDMVEAGRLVRYGRNKSARYVIPGRDGTVGQNAQGGLVAAE